MDYNETLTKGYVMPREINANIKFIEFDLRDWDLGFYITLRIPYSHHNYAVVLAMPDSACIKLIK